MVLFNTIEMILQENNTTKTQLKKWYKSPAGQHYRKIILNELEAIKDLYQGRHTLFCGSSEYKKLFQKNKSGTFFSIDEDVLISSANLSKNLPFEDNSHDVIVLSHGLEYTENPYLLMREIDRIATDDATIVVIGFNKFSLWSLIKIFSSKPPWNINFLSPYIIKEWFKILEYKTNYQKTFGFIPYLGKNVTSFLSNISFLHKIIRNQFGGLAMVTYRKRVIPLTPQKIIFNKNYKLAHLAKNNI
jgi:SAM-dependent methyltransferase